MPWPITEYLRSASPVLPEQIADVAQAHPVAVERIFVGAVSVGAPADLYLAVFDREEAVAVVEGDQHFGHAGAGAWGCPIDHVVGAFAAQQAKGLLAERPANGVGYVGFAAAVGADHGGDARAEFKFGFVGKRFIAGEGELFEAHDRRELITEAQRAQKFLFLCLRCASVVKYLY